MAREKFSYQMRACYWAALCCLYYVHEHNSLESPGKRTWRTFISDKIPTELTPFISGMLAVAATEKPTSNGRSGGRPRPPVVIVDDEPTDNQRSGGCC